MKNRAQAKILIFISIILILGFAIFAYSNPPEQPEITRKYTPSTSTICKTINGKETCNLILYSGAMFAQNSLGDWVDSSEVLSITKNSDDLTFHYDGIKGYFNVTFEAGVIYNGNYYSMQEVKSLYPEIKFNFPSTKQVANIKYAVNITNIPLDKSKIENITLTYKDHYGFTLDQLKSEKGRFIAKDTIALLFGDLIEYGFTTNIVKSEKRIYISNITLDKFNSDSLYLDPTLNLNVADVENLEDTNIREGYLGTNYGTASTAYLGNDGNPEDGWIYTKFNISSIPSGVIINDATFALYCQGFDYVDADTVNIYLVKNQDWWEMTPTWNTRGTLNASGSALDTLLLTDIAFNFWNVTSGVKTEYSAEHVKVSFVLKGTIPSQGQSHHSMKEHATVGQRPALNITYTTTPPPDSDPPIIILHSPYNSTTKTTSDISFIYNVSDASSIDECRLYLNTSLPLIHITKIDASIIKDINQSIDLTNIQDENYYWKIQCKDSISNYGNSTINSFTINVPSGFPAPDYDSGWVDMSQGEIKILSHNLGGDADDYFIFPLSKDYDSIGLNNLYLGLSKQDIGNVRRGWYFRNLNTTSVEVYKGTDDSRADAIRIRIWKYN